MTVVNYKQIDTALGFPGTPYKEISAVLLCHHGCHISLRVEREDSNCGSHIESALQCKMFQQKSLYVSASLSAYSHCINSSQNLSSYSVQTLSTEFNY